MPTGELLGWRSAWFRESGRLRLYMWLVGRDQRSGCLRTPSLCLEGVQQAGCPEQRPSTVVRAPGAAP